MTNVKKCSGKECAREFKNHYWGSIKAHDEGWFEQKDGTVYCPEHVPDWVATWREKKSQGK